MSLAAFYRLRTHVPLTPDLGEPMTGNVGSYAKFIVAALLAGAYALQAAISDGTVTNTEWLGIAVACLSALGVLAVPNARQSDRKPTPYPTGRN